jgi:signal transduction histidine kinase
MAKHKKKLIINDRIKILSQTKIFEKSDNLILFDIANVLKEKHVKKEKIVLKKGDTGNAMYIIVKGSVRVHDGNHVLSRLTQGSVFGEYSLIDEETRSASVTAEEDSILLKLSQEDFYVLVSKNQEILNNVLKVLIGRMRDMNALEEKLAKSYIKIQNQKQEIEEQHHNILEQKQLLEEQNYDLLSLNEEKNQLMTVMVHNMKDPLTSSLCMIDILKSEITDTEHPYYAHTQVIYSSLERMNKMINEVLNLNKIESKFFQLQVEKLYLNKIVKNVISHFKFSIEQKQLKINLFLEESYSRLNSVYTYQIFDNLISNAIKFSPINSTITISLINKSSKIIFKITDEGPGIHKNLVENLFNLYERQSDWKKENPNEGLGLSIVKKYVEAMKGTVWFESELGKGCTFYVEFNRLDG